MARRSATGPTMVLMVRHGQTSTTGKVLPGRAKGLHLADEGRDQADRAASRIAGLERVSAVYASPLERTRETAAPIAAAVGHKVRTAKGLLECEFGEWTGKRLSTLRKRPEWSQVQNRPSIFRFPGGESFAEMQLRIWNELQRLVSEHPGETVVAVSHADPIKAAVAMANGVHLDLFQRIVISPCSITPVLFTAQGPVVLAVNSTGDDLGPSHPPSLGGRSMSAPFDFEQLDSFIPGAIGEPGQRVFYLQARRGHDVVSFRIEKEQVTMLGRYLGQLATAMGAPDPERDIAGLIEPVDPQWVVGTISVGVDENSGIIQVTTEELVPEELEIEVGDDFTEDDIEELLDSDVGSGAQARFTLRTAQAAAFAEAAEELVAAGRPPCRLCGRPIGAEGHACPRWN